MDRMHTVVSATDRSSDPYAVAREALSGVPLSVVVIGAAVGMTRSCATGTTMYVSFAPPCVAVALHRGSTTRQLIDESEAFSVSVLREDQLDVAAAAGHGAKGDDKFAALGLTSQESDAAPGVPALADAARAMWCQVRHRLETGDHILFVGEVVAFTEAADGAAPLLRHERRYATRGGWLTEVAPEGYPT